MGSLLRDLRFSYRLFLQNPGFTAVALLSLALGIGANTTIFSVVNTVLLRPFPVKDPERLVLLFEYDQKKDRRRLPTSPVFREWKKQSTVFEGMVRGTMGGGGPMTLTGAGEAARVRLHPVDPEFLSFTGVHPLIGRTFDPDELPPSDLPSPTVVISHGLWQRQFGADPQVLGRTVSLEGAKHTIIGVMPPGFWVFPWAKDVDVWLAYNRDHMLNAGGFSVFGRLKPGVTLQQAQAEMDTIARRIEQANPKTNAGWGIRVEPLQEWSVEGYRESLYVLLGVVGFVLLIACANVASLLLARAAMRQKEIAVRASLGASRWRLIRQLLTESVLAALVGGGLGTLVALWGVELFVALAPQWFARSEEIGIDPVVLLFTFGLSVFTGVLFGLAPALHASKPDLNESLKEAGGRSAGGSRHRGRSALVVSEVALALVLLIGAGLMINSFLRLQGVDPGFNPKNLLTANILLAGKKYWDYIEGDMKRVTPQVEIFYQRILEEIQRLPGVESAGIISSLGGGRPVTVQIAGKPAPPQEEPQAGYGEVSPDLFRTMGVPLLKGRFLAEGDVQGSPWVVVINESFARQFFRGEDPIGKVLHLTMRVRFATGLEAGEGRPRQIVGVVGDIRHWGPRRDPPAMVYGPYRQHLWEYPGGRYEIHAGKSLVIRTASDPMGLAAAVQRVVAEVDSDEGVFNIMTVEQSLSRWSAQNRLYMQLFGIFAGLAVFLAMGGIYGVISYSVTQRTHEIGIRMALGAEKAGVLKLVLKQGLSLALIGVVIGVGGAIALTRLIARFLYGVKPTDPLTFVVVAIMLTAVALAACYIPARRATKIDPMVALRYE